METYNLSELTDKNYSYFKNFESLLLHHYDDDEVSNRYISLMVAMKTLRSTYVAPAYHCNRYIGCQHEPLRFDMQLPGDEHNTRLFNTQIALQIEFHAALYSIKMLLDRLVPMFAEWCKGVPKKGIFGGVDNKGEGKGFMKYVFDNHTQNSFFAWVLDEYHSWIKNVAKPRNMITHEKDLIFMFRTNGDISSATAEITPVHMLKGLKDAKDWKDTEPLDVVDLQTYINKLYAFFDKTMSWFSENPHISLVK